MITPEEIKKKGDNLYYPFLKSYLANENFFPKAIPSNKKISDDFIEMSKELELLIKNSKNIKGYGYTVTLEERKTIKNGVQTLPSGVKFDTEKDFLKFINKDEEFELFKENVNLILHNFPELKDWIQDNIKSIIQNSDNWECIINVCKYFILNPKPNLYIRELEIENIDTKFIETNKGIISSLLDFLIKEHVNFEYIIFEHRYNLKSQEPLIRVRILDNRIALEKYSGINDLSVPISVLINNPIFCKTVFILENQTNFNSIFNFLSFPELKNCIAIFGSGFKSGILKNIEWLKDKKIYYWGDIDAQGFEILNSVKSFLPDTQSIMMDFETLNKFERLVVNGKETKLSDLRYLNETERATYIFLVKNNQRLEQERINQSYVNNILFNLLYKK